MSGGFSSLLKTLSPARMAKAIQTFDRFTILIISICWTTTITVILFALYTVNLSIAAQRSVEAALATEPVLPAIRRSGVGGKDLQIMIDRLQRRYPEVSITWSNGVLTLAGANGGRYHQWLTAIGQVDTLYPQFHWKIQSLCVGAMCGGQNLMTINLVGEKVSFEKPQTN